VLKGVAGDWQAKFSYSFTSDVAMKESGELVDPDLIFNASTARIFLDKWNRKFAKAVIAFISRHNNAQNAFMLRSD
jgi:hypothetical protein